MRVCHFCSANPDSHYFANLSKGLSSNGVALFLGSLNSNQAPAWLQEIAGARYFSLGTAFRGAYPLAVIRLARLLRRERIEILQTHLFDAGLIGVLAARLARIPVTIVTRHHTDEASLVGTNVHVALDRLMARMADRVVVLSQAVRNHMIAREHVPGDKIEVIYQGFDFEAFSATEADRERVRAEFGLQSNFVIGCVARFYKTKGHDYLLAALRDLVREIPEIRLLLLGGGDRSAIMNMIRDYELQEQVVFAGYRNDVAACMKAMDVVVHPSLTEAFCQAHIEALASGRPLVATNVAAAPEVITHGETGMLIPVRDSSAIVRTVLDLYHNSELRQRIALAGQKSVVKRFTVERMVNHQIDCYRRWLNQPLRPHNYDVATKI